MKMTFLPKTRKGKWAVVVFLISIVLHAATIVISIIQENEIEFPNPINSPLLGTALYLTFATAFIAALFGLLAVIKDRERSILVYVSIPLGIFYFVIFVVGVVQVLKDFIFKLIE